MSDGLYTKEQMDREREDYGDGSVEPRPRKPRELTPAEMEAKERAERLRKNEMQRKHVQKSSKHFDSFTDAANWRKGMKVAENQKVRIRKRVEGFDVVLYQRKDG